MKSETPPHIDLARYPPHDLTGSAGRAPVDATHAESDDDGLATLPGFLRPEAFDRILDRALADAESGSHRFTEISDVFFSTEPGNDRTTGLNCTHPPRPEFAPVPGARHLQPGRPAGVHLGRRGTSRPRLADPLSATGSRSSAPETSMTGTST